MSDYQELSNKQKVKTRRDAMILSDIFKILAEDPDLDPKAEAKNVK